jgi:hypothetical protein
MAPVALDHIDDYRMQDRRVADDSDGRFLEPLVAPEDGPVSVTSDIGVTVQHYAEVRCPAQLRVHEASKLRRIPTSKCPGAPFGCRDDFLGLRFHRRESRLPLREL